ncbi:FeoB-associated Cys-rich membrane protein [Peptostreptococcus porci]|uniref:FeoB-associated Cys-rich membrane protein n=1 Tax=Peptostreptococcus porci TaxID=2652282 RepID=A0A6N7X0C2_9FIRM|nr:FeoB-associated Cys-rich membrane protein [Peptostreptococcus porci]MDD7182656.1 FeoB-associated Cys-rich membrane protein [Peptostreptococcus porci]MDY2795494.1 FeoB-associated Cys-rich membrane protein [Peptostreptococcus porci]MDY4128001.1 FeoB-associated Cys-rich membrane protein [Peptostreptococcus porci]MDY5436924.1 FeoB-associated Cys-rich membrane protein [Peptostreptococcus porci]MDY5964401.1 FeoB-associated Cys-rich membrane protein [Peptostreptococcus porci]
MNLPTILVLIVLAVVVGFSIKKLRKSGGCSGCSKSGCGSCSSGKGNH